MLMHIIICVSFKGDDVQLVNQYRRWSFYACIVLMLVYKQLLAVYGELMFELRSESLHHICQFPLFCHSPSIPEKLIKFNPVAVSTIEQAAEVLTNPIRIMIDISSFSKSGIKKIIDACESSAAIAYFYNSKACDYADGLMGLSCLFGMIEENHSDELIEKGVHHLLCGNIWLPRHVMQMQLEKNKTKMMRADMGISTCKEQKVLRLLASGKSNVEIADQLFISENTVKTHVRNVYQKYGIHNRAEAVLLFAKMSKVDDFIHFI